MIALDWTHLATAAVVLLLNAGVSLYWRLGLGNRLLVAALRASVQLLLVGLVLEWLFGLRSAPAVLLLLVAMGAVAAVTARGRLGHSAPGIGAVLAIAILASTLLLTLFGTLVVLRAERWWEPRLAIPIAGMLIGNALTGVTLAADRLLGGLDTERGRVEALLAHGASPREALADLRRESARSGMIPILNSMLVAGIVALPGMMTGQILAGAPPVQAVRYQLAILFLIAGATATGVVIVVQLAPRLLFDAAERPRWEALHRRST